MSTAAATVQCLELTPAPSVNNVALALADRPHLVVFDSANCGGPRGRYSFVAADPVEFQTHCYSDLVTAARRRGPLIPLAGLPPFQTGYAGLFSYGLANEWEPTPVPQRDEFTIPPLAVGRYDIVVSFDHLAGRAWAVAHPSVSRTQLRQFAASLTRRPNLRALPSSASLDIVGRHELPGIRDVTSNFSREHYITAITRAIEYIRAGDCFQVNLSQQLTTRLTAHPLNLWLKLRDVSPAPFGGYYDLGAEQIVSASPERFLEVTHDGIVTTRPIKGTRPRRATPELDAAEVRDLLTSPKDHAENIMIVDLLRNDLGRVAEIGSVTVPRVCELESFAHVHHLVSEIRARLAPSSDIWDLLRAALPGGSVTGTPKIRAMQIIAELEPTSRGAYCGSLGYISSTGVADTNILIRTFTATRGWYQFSVGGGIVADSDPAQEYQETLHKAAGLLAALEL